jgi:hypothetical protein
MFYCVSLKENLFRGLTQMENHPLPNVKFNLECCTSVQGLDIFHLKGTVQRDLRGVKSGINR